MSTFSIRTAKARRNHRRDLVRAIALALCASAAHAGTYTVGTEAELIQAINDANANTGADTIDVTADIMLSAALPTISDALTIAGSGGQRAIARDDTGTNACSPTATNAFRLIDAGADLSLNDLTLSGGCNLVDQGGAVRVQNASLSVTRSTISGNTTFYPDVANPCYGQCIGGGIAVLYGNATISDSTFTGNVVAQGYSAEGGGIGVYQGDLTVTNSTLSGNQSAGVGGGIYANGVYPNGPAGTVTISNSTLAGNAGGYGGGLTVDIEAVTITDSRITGNIADHPSEANGGGIFINNIYVEVTSRVERTLISDNVVTSDQGGFGGGIWVRGSTFELVDSAVVNNTVTADAKARAGAIFIEDAVTSITNSTLSGNSITGAISGGGAIMVDCEDPNAASLVLRNSTVTGNSSNNTGGGIYLKRDTPTGPVPSVSVESSIVAGNQGAGGLDAIGTEASTPATVTADHSLIQGEIDIGIGSFTPDPVTIALLDADPLLGPLAMNGGATPTQALAPDSPAIDQGSNPAALEYDQRGAGYPRVVGAATDIGAFEYDADVVFANGFD